MSGPGKIESTVSENRVKLHVFEPSMRSVWTIVGKSKEHWIDPSGHYCSCRGYHYSVQGGRKSCYHLDSAQLAISQHKIEIVRFSDNEFSNFIHGLVSDL